MVSVLELKLCQKTEVVKFEVSEGQELNRVNSELEVGKDLPHQQKEICCIEDDIVVWRNSS